MHIRGRSESWVKYEESNSFTPFLSPPIFSFQCWPSILKVGITNSAK